MRTSLTCLALRYTVAEKHKGSRMQDTNHGLVMSALCMLRQSIKVLKTCIFLCAAVLCITALSYPSAARDLSVLAKLDVPASSFDAEGADISLTVAISQSVPWRVRLLANPARVVLDFREVDFSSIATVPVNTPHIKAVRAGIFRPGWSRLVLELDAPFRIKAADMATEGGKVAVKVRLVSTDSAAFAHEAGQPEAAEWALPKPALPSAHKQRHDGPLVVVLDPGHGGIDPGAVRDGDTEAKLVLTFARELKELLLREGRFKVILTRDDDIFVPLETRISIARAENADVLVSLHADALAEGEAVGAAIYTLSGAASEAAGATLAERHDRNDLLAGIDLAGQDDVIATVLMDMARTETAPRTARLASALEDAMLTADIKMHPVPLQSAGFSVLKSPDIPSVLIELGFLSSARDLARLTDKKWRGRMAEAIRNGIMIWAQEDAALQGLRRR